ncbi:MAG: rhodanese-like domain-containing protein [Gemmatimonadota bacterium]|nr:rhodanese-like domain-containing protein [Gemmatimonadota bacterium]MDH5759834.1 rhodanese-like domain-containing protein [Gemmatimonadota bacterium]
MSPSNDVPEISCTELKERLDRGDVPVLVDVREHFEQRIADLPEHGQIRIPTGEILSRMHELDPDAETVVYCRTGSRSAWAVRLLQERGFPKTVNLAGGVMGWRADVDPTLQRY